MRLKTLFLAMALSALPVMATAHIADPFTPPAGLHPHKPASQHEIPGDNPLPQQTQRSAIPSKSDDVFS